MDDDHKTKPLTPWKVSRGPIKVDRYSLEAAKAVNVLLAAPIGVLPQAEGDLVLPFNVGIGVDIEARLKPGAALPQLRKAVRRYTHSAGYLYATAQPDARRHDINGEAGDPVSAHDRLNARQSFVAVQEQRKKRREQREQERSAEMDETNSGGDPEGR